MDHKTHVCPKDICDMFKGDEASKSRGRLMAISWVQSQKVSPGDLVLLPFGNGELVEFSSGGHIRQQ